MASISRWAARWRSRRFTLLRVTALPTCLDTTKPTCVVAPESGAYSARSACITRVGRPTRTPWRTVARKTWEFFSRAGAGNTTQADSSARPLRRRAERMERPARVLMRARKPWVRARRRLLGWYVRLLTGRLPTVSKGGSQHLAWPLTVGTTQVGMLINGEHHAKTSADFSGLSSLLH